MLNDKIKNEINYTKESKTKKNSIYENEDQIWNKKINEMTN
jgi:hypothetical protein